jgi:hypothetical protein
MAENVAQNAETTMVTAVPRGRLLSRSIARLGVAAGVAACGGAPPRAPIDKSEKVTAVELSAFEVRDDQVDRFEHCPPAGDIGQDWIPPIPEWHPPAVSTSAAVPESAVGTDPTSFAPPGSDLPPPPPPASQAVLTTTAVNASRTALRRCYHQGLLYDPTQDGHVGLVLRVDRTGHVASVETWGACDLTPSAIACMRDEAAQVRLPPPADGPSTVVVPAVFTNGAPQVKGGNDGYAAGAYVSIESMRPRLHACLDAAHRAGADVIASAVMTIDVDGSGRGVHIAVDQWKGAQGLLGCAAEVLRDASFPRPPAGQGRVVVPIVFNPRAGTR